MSEFHFLRPAWLLALVPAVVLLTLLWRRRADGAGWRTCVAPALLAHLLLDADRPLHRLPLLLLGAGWLLAVVALAGPVWERQPATLYRAPADRVIVLDMSPSMASADLQPDRLSRARLALRGLLSQLREGRTALVVFGAEPHVVAPLTDDVATIEALLPALSVDILPVAGDQAGPALRLAGALLQRVHSTQGTVLLVSDGVADTADSLQAVRDLRRAGVRVSVLGIGTTNGAPVPAAGGFATAADGGLELARLDETGLAALASAGGGHYQRLGDGMPVTLLATAVARDPAQAAGTAQGVERWVERGPWLLLPLLLLAAAGYRRGWLGLLLILVLPPPPAQAFGWQDLWLRPDQQAARLLARGDAGAAAARFENPDWRAMARYRAGDYAAAADGFTGTAPDSLYNRATALARAGRLQEALTAYDTVLQRDAGHTDARHNRELVARLLQDQQQSAGQQHGSGQDQPDSGQGQQSGQSGQSDNTGTSGSQVATQSGADRQAGGAGAQERQASAAQTGPPEPQSESASQQPSAQPGAQGQDAAAVPQTGGAPGADEQQNAGKDGGEPQATAQAHDNTAPDRAGGDDAHEAAAPEPAGSGAPTGQPEQPAASTPPAERPPDSAQRARADVSGAGAAPGRAAGAATETPDTEQDIAMEQWLRQIPDDPAGLLRRKFMVEHLLRQQGQSTP
ncbi:MAG: VWA domain-containing protein [Pseudomonadota bacterium]